MNNLIETFVEQAGLYQGTAEGDCPVCSAFDYKKFAELIVRECVKVVDDTMTENQEMNIGLVMASAKIVAHFGVEE